MAIRECNVTIMVKDMNTSVSFYEALGFITKNRWGDHYAQLTAPGVIIGLHPTNDQNIKQDSGNVSIGFTMDDLKEARSILEKLGVEAKAREEEGGQFLHFHDPDGTALYFIKPKW